MRRRDVLHLLLGLAPAWRWATAPSEQWWRKIFGPGDEPVPARPVLDWAWSGGVTTNRATIVAKARAVTTPLVAHLRRADGLVIDLQATPVGTAPGLFRFATTTLVAATDYVCTFSASGSTLVGETRFRTFADGPQDALVVFGSCATTGSNSVIFDTMRESRPDLFVHLGDLHYDNIQKPDTTRFRRAFDRVLTSPRQSALFRSAPIVYVWDDHDFGGNDSDRTSPSAPAAHQVYRECVPHYPLEGDVRGTIQQALTIGRVRLLITDSRSGRDPIDRKASAPTSMLGAAQRAWLLRELESARDAPLVVWANPVPWITKADERTEHGWAPYAAERVEIANRIEELELTRRLIMISGDAHMVAIDDGTNSQYASTAPAGAKGFPVIHGAPFDRFRNKKGGPYSHGLESHRGQFGELRIKDDGTTIVVTMTARDKHGRVLKELSFTASLPTLGRSRAIDV